MQDPGGVVIAFTLWLSLLPPIAVMWVIQVQMLRLRDLFLSEIEKLRLELRPQFSPEKQLEPKVAQLEADLKAIGLRLDEISRLMEESRKPAV